MSGSQPKYVLTERIAQGGMAEIHLGKSVGSDGFARVCAFKRILPHFASDAEFIQMFRNEAMVAKQLQNKNIVQVFDFVGDGQSYMLVMEFVDGPDLRSVLAGAEAAKKRIPAELACYICIEMLSGLAYAHAAVDVSGKSMGIVHRDVSPQNILMSYEGDIKVTDFGIAKAENQGSTTRAGVLKGKFRYMSPEQALGLQMDARSDIFAVGVILYEMLTMTRLFKGEDMVVLEAVRTCKIKPPSQLPNTKIPPELDAIVMKLLAKDVTKRYANGREAIKDLSKFLYSYRPDFFAGEMAEFMQLLFREKIATARERLRSTLALPVGAMGAGGMLSDMLRSDPFTPVSSGGVMDLSRPGMTASQINSQMSPNQNSATPPNAAMRPASPPPPRQGGGGNEPPLEVVGGKNVANQGRPVSPSGAMSGTGVNGGSGQRQAAGTNNQRHTRQRMAHHLAGIGTQATNIRKPSMSVEAQLGTLLAAGLVLFAGVGVMFKAKIISIPSDLEITATPATGRFMLEIDGVKQFGGQAQQLPLRVKLDAGTHKLVLYRNGFKPRRFQVNAGLLGSKSKEHLILEKEAAAFGQVRIVTNPPGAKVVLDQGADVGESPYTFEYLPVGKAYSFKISHPKCADSKNVRENLRAGDDRQLIVRTFNLKKCKP